MTKNFNKITLDKPLHLWYNKSGAFLYLVVHPYQSFNERGNIVKKLTMSKRLNCLVKYLTMSQSLMSTAPMGYPPRAEPASQARQDSRRTQHTQRIDTYIHSTHNDTQHRGTRQAQHTERHTHTDKETQRERSTVRKHTERHTHRQNKDIRIRKEMRHLLIDTYIIDKTYIREVCQ